MMWIRIVSVAAVVGVSSFVLASGTGQALAGVPRGVCPTAVLVLPADGVARASARAVAEAAADYPGLDTKGAVVVRARPARSAGPRGAQVGAHCGAKVRNRTVVVELRFPQLLPSASLSEGVVDVSRFVGGYRVWNVVH
jgi:hypothetical protein